MVSNGTNPSYHWLLGVVGAVPWILITLALTAIIGFSIPIGLRLLQRRRLLHGSFVLLEVTPPALTDKSQLATSQLVALLHQLSSPHSLVDKLLQRNAILSLEIVSSRARGIRYMLYLAKSDAALAQREIAAYLPGTRFKKVKDYTATLPKKSTIRAVEFRQTGHPSLPLQTQDMLSQHDPVSYMTGAMTQLKTSELIVFQLLLVPLSGRPGSLLASRSPLPHKRRSWAAKTLHVVMQTLLLSLKLIMRIAQVVRVMVLDAPSREHRYTIAAQTSGSAPDKALLEARQSKLSQPLFRADVRTLIVAEDPQSAAQRVRALESSLASFDESSHQSLRMKHRWPHSAAGRACRANLLSRLPGVLPGSTNILSATEVADLYHFPYGAGGQTENLVKSLSRSLPAPVSLKGRAKYDVLLGNNVHLGMKTPIGLTAAERERHIYITGGTGNGKTTMLLYAMGQDIRGGKGLAVIDPHGDLAETILKYIPKKRLGDVIYFNPDDVAYPVGLNLLEIPPGLTGDELVHEKDLITETVISVFRKIFSGDDDGGHRIEYVLRNTIQTALTTEGATIFTIFRLLTNGKFRRQTVAELEDQDLKDFWNSEMGKAGDFQRIKMSAGITAKVGRFLFSGSAKRILGQSKSTIDFDDIINSGKILICNFSKGLLGEDTASLFGITVLAKLQIATLRRARMQPSERKPFYLYVDEFQNFATMSFVQLMSEARKYKLFLNMAEQSTSQQQDERIINIILANVGTVICFRSASPADERFLLPVFAPFISSGEIAYLPPFHFYIRIAAAISQEPFSGETVLLSDPGTHLRVQQVIESSREKYTIQETSEAPIVQSFIDLDDYEIDSPLALS